MKLLNTLVSLGLLSTCAIAQEVTQQAETKKEATYVVTANRIKTDAKKIGKSFSIITAEDIKNSNANDLADLLRRTPGLHVVQTGPNGSTSIFMRGMESYHTKVLIDGSHLADTTSTQISSNDLLSFIDIKSIERIEIIRGGQSVLHGSDAVGGVINIITKKGGEENLAGSISQEYGEEHYKKTALNLNGSIDDFSYRFSGFYEDERGISSQDTISDLDELKNKGGNLKLAYDITDQIQASLTGTYLDTDNLYDTGSAGFDDYFHYQAFTLRPEITITDILEDLDLKMSVSHSDIRRTNISMFAFDSQSETRQYEVGATYKGFDQHTLSAGIDLQNQRSITNQGLPIEVDLYEAYVQDQIAVTENYNVTLGLRQSKHSLFGTETTYQISNIYHFDDLGLSLHSSFGTAYRAPSPSELFGRFGPNSELTPELAQSFDFGFDQVLGDKEDIRFGATFFYNSIEDVIEYRGAFPNSQYTNVSELVTKGIEAYVTYDIRENLQVTANYTRTHSYQKEENTETTQALRRPLNSANLIVNYQPIDKLDLEASLNYLGTRTDADFHPVTFAAVSVRHKQLTLVNLAASYELNDNIRVFGKLNNVFNQNYQLAQNYNNYGRTVYGGLELSF